MKERRRKMVSLREGDREKKISMKREGQRGTREPDRQRKMVSLHEGDREKKIAMKRKGQRERKSLTYRE